MDNRKHVDQAQFLTDDGNYDYKAYKAARLANGDICFKCHGSVNVLFGGEGIPEMCYSCRMISDDDGDVNHDHLLRCPYCGETEDVDGWDCDYGDKYLDGEHATTCSSCERDYVFTTHASYSYTSPPRVKE